MDLIKVINHARVLIGGHISQAKKNPPHPQQTECLVYLTFGTPDAPPHRKAHLWAKWVAHLAFLIKTPLNGFHRLTRPQLHQ